MDQTCWDVEFTDTDNETAQWGFTDIIGRGRHDAIQLSEKIISSRRENVSDRTQA